MLYNESVAYKSYEIIEGEKFMAPMPKLFHSGIIMRLAARIFDYVDKKKCGYVFTDNVDVYFPDGNLFNPDLVVVTSENRGIMNWQGAIHGTPDMVVEVLSRSTKKKDLTIKKEIYEKNGVKEYWIIDPRYKSVDVYILRDGKFEFDGEYFKYDEEELKTLTEEEKAAEKTEIKVGIFDDLIINVEDIFSWGCES